MFLISIHYLDEDSSNSNLKWTRKPRISQSSNYIYYHNCNLVINVIILFNFVILLTKFSDNLNSKKIPMKRKFNRKTGL